MKINVTIESKKYEEKIVEICIKNGHWKYWDDRMECPADEKISLTINNITQAKYLTAPVKDEVEHYDHKLYRETGELKVIGASTRTYDTLHEFIIYRIDNSKDDYKRLGKLYDDWKHYEFKCTLFDERYVKLNEQSLDKDIVYEVEDELIIRIDFE